MVVSMAIFAIEDMFIKQASAFFPTGQIITLLGLGGAVIFALWSIVRREAPMPPALFRGAALMRSIFEAVATLCFTMALALVPLALFTTVMQANPLLVTLGAALIFGHPVGWRRWSAIGIGLVGVLIVVRPFGSGFELTALWVVGGVILQAGRDLITSRVPRSITTLQISTAAFAALIPTGIVVAVVSGTPFVWPELEGWLRLGGAIGTGIPAIYAIIMANRIGDVSFVAPFRYSRIVFGLTLSVLVFDEVLDGYTLIGAAIIVASGLYTLAREAQLRRASQRAQAAL